MHQLPCGWEDAKGIEGKKTPIHQGQDSIIYTPLRDLKQWGIPTCRNALSPLSRFHLPPKNVIQEVQRALFSSFLLGLSYA